MIKNSVFISGSISIKTLPQEVKDSIHKIVDNQMKILVGDANGIDSLVQDYCLSLGYFNVTVYSISTQPRYKASDKFGLKIVTPPTKIKGTRERQQEKDKAMTKDSQYSFIIWDGKSKGSYANIIRAFEQDKKIKLYAENRFLKQHEINQQNIEAIYRNPSFFKISLKKKKFKEDLEEMETFKVHKFWNALTSSQKKLAIKYGHVAP